MLKASAANTAGKNTASRRTLRSIYQKIRGMLLRLGVWGWFLLALACRDTAGNEGIGKEADLPTIDRHFMPFVLHYRLPRKYSRLPGGLFTVEGAHSFGHYLHNSTFQKQYDELYDEERRTLRDSFLRNLTEVKTEDDGRSRFGKFASPCGLIADPPNDTVPMWARAPVLGWPGWRTLFFLIWDLEFGILPLLNLVFSQAAGPARVAVRGL